MDEHKWLLVKGLSPALMSGLDSDEVEISPEEPASVPGGRSASWTPLQQQLRRQGINRLLEAVYKGPRLVSEILHDGGFDQAAVDTIRLHRLGPFLKDVVQGWEAEFVRSLPGPRWYVLMRRFSLDGQPASTLTDIGLELNLSRERVRQLEKSAITRLRARKRKERLEGVIMCAARRCLEADHPGSS